MLINFNDRHAITVSGMNNCPGKVICEGDLVLFTMKKNNLSAGTGVKHGNLYRMG